MASFSTITPVFLRQRDIPDSANTRPTVLEMCLAAERVAGHGSILGAQDIRGLWRIYPSTKEARAELLVKGMRVRETVLQVSNTNPFILRDDTGEEKPTTKVWIDNVPISVANSEIEHSLTKIGCQLRSAIQAERARDADHRLTRFLTGRRFVFITVPPTPLDKDLKVSLFTAKIFHREQKLVQKTTTCSKCLEQGHHVSMCENELVCRACKRPGHKRGDPLCQLSAPARPTQGSRPVDGPDQRSSGGQETTARATRSGSVSERATCATGATGAGEKAVVTDGVNTDERRGGEREDGQTNQRGRTCRRQTTLRSILELEHPRSRSETPKRRRSREAASPREGTEKQARRDDSQAPPDTEHGAGGWG